MIHPTPLQDNRIEHSGTPTIRTVYRDYESTFVVLHPFLQIKPNYTIQFEAGNWPQKKDIITCTRNVSWADIIERAGLKDVGELDRLLAYLHCERRTADRDGWIKLMTLLERQNIVPAEVDYLPTSLTNPLMAAIRSRGYTTINEFEFTGCLRKQHNLDTILTSEEQDFFAYARLATPDRKIVLATDFDKRFSYLSSSKEVLRLLIEEANLEGFYCNETTRPDWSLIEQTGNTIDWSSPERTRKYA